MLHILPNSHRADLLGMQSAIQHSVSADAAYSSLEYGKEFDEAAKCRMISGCRMLAPWIEESLPLTGKKCIEFGPFRNPLLEITQTQGASVTYVDGDAQVVAELRAKHRQNSSVSALCTDLNSPIPLNIRLLGMARTDTVFPIKFDILVASQIINYINYVKFFEEITQLAAVDAVLYLNNVIDYGIPELFSNQRPKSDDEVVVALEKLGWSIERHASVPSPFTQQEHPRLLIMAKKSPYRKVSHDQG